MLVSREVALRLFLIAKRGEGGPYGVAERCVRLAGPVPPRLEESILCMADESIEEGVLLL